VITVAGVGPVPGGAIGNVPLPLPAITFGAGQMIINGVDVTPGFPGTPAGNTASQNATALVTQINSFAGQTGVIASTAPNNPTRLVLTSRGSTIDVQSGGAGLSPTQATGMAVGKTKTQNTIFQSLLNFRQSLINVKTQPGLVDSISLQNIGEVGQSLENLTNVRSVLGAQASRLEKSASRLDALNVSDQSLLSQNEDTDFQNALTQLSQEETVYRAALGVGSRILPPSLMDFMH
jgi:flagellin-like hook-associated protein FlgL